MVNLLVLAPSSDEKAVAFRFGGRPLVPAGTGFQWPTCRKCKGAMQFLGQLPLEGNLMVSLFMCQNDPGGCSEWDANEGGNAAFVFQTVGVQNLLAPPEKGETLLGGSWGGVLQAVAVEPSEMGEHEPAYRIARSRHAVPRAVLGVVGGDPDWIQGEEVPSCDTCGSAMSFVAQLEEGPDFRTAMNFGGGSAYVFKCGCGKAKFLWQQ